MISISAIIQIAILYFAIYYILKSARGSRFGQALMGIALLTMLLAAFTFLFHFHVLSLIIKYLLIYLAISSVVIFQPEIRRILATVGAFGGRPQRFSRREKDGAVSAEELADALGVLASKKIGALLAFERAISLRGYEASAVGTDAIITRELLLAIFTPPLPLHDGGAVVRHGRIASAHCIFPVSGNPALAASGMRHRAAVGLSEETDAIVVAVSEETGSISVAHNGKLIRYNATDAASVTKWISKGLGEKKGGEGALARMAGTVLRRFATHQRKSVAGKDATAGTDR